MKKLVFSAGDSVCISIVFPENRISYIEEIRVTIFGIEVASKIKGTLHTTISNNVFLVKMPSSLTNKFRGDSNVIITVQYSDVGVKKSKKVNSLPIFVEKSEDVYSSGSVSIVVDATIIIEYNDSELIQNIILATVQRGYSALDVFRMEHDMPNASNDDMLQFSLMRERRNFFVGNINYIGVGKLGSSDEQEVWKITKIVIAENGQTLVTRANNVAWNNKLNINYN